MVTSKGREGDTVNLRPVTDDPAYDAAMNALHDATGESHAWDVAWAPEAMQPRLLQCLQILGAAILEAEAKGCIEGRDECLAEARKLAAEYEAKGRAEALEEAARECERHAQEIALMDEVPMRESSAIARQCARDIRALAAQKPEPRT